MKIHLCNGLHCNMFLLDGIRAEFIPLTKREFNTILNKNRRSIKSYIGHKQLAKRLSVKLNRENTNCEKGDIILIYCGNNRKNADNFENNKIIRMIIYIAGLDEVIGEKEKELNKNKLMEGQYDC